MAHNTAWHITDESSIDTRSVAAGGGAVAVIEADAFSDIDDEGRPETTMTVLDSVFEGNVCRGDQVCTRSDMCGEAHGGALYAGGVSLRRRRRFMETERKKERKKEGDSMRKNERDITNGRVFATTCVCWFVFVVPKRHWLCRRVLIRCVLS